MHDTTLEAFAGTAASPICLMRLHGLIHTLHAGRIGPQRAQAAASACAYPVAGMITSQQGSARDRLADICESCM